MPLLDVWKDFHGAMVVHSHCAHRRRPLFEEIMQPDVGIVFAVASQLLLLILLVTIGNIWEQLIYRITAGDDICSF